VPYLKDARSMLGIIPSILFRQCGWVTSPSAKKPWWARFSFPFLLAGLCGFVGLASYSSQPVLVWQEVVPISPRAVAISPDGQTLAVGESSWTVPEQGPDLTFVKLWRIPTGEFLGQLDLNVPVRMLRPFASESASSDAGAGEDGRVALRVTALAWSGDGSLLAAGGEDHFHDSSNAVITVWRMPEKRLIGTFGWREGSIEQVSFSPDNQWVAALGRVFEKDDKAIRVWRLKDGAILSSNTFSSRLPLALTAGGHFVLGSNFDGCIYLRQLPGGEILRRIPVEQLQPPGRGEFQALGPSCGDKFFVAAIKGLIRIIAADGGREIASLPGRLAWLPGRDDDDCPGFSCGAFTGDCRFFVWGDESTEVHPSSWADIHSIRLEGDALLRSIFSAHNGSVTGVSFSRENKVMASVGTDDCVKVWSFPEFRPLFTRCGMRLPANEDVVFSSDGQYLVSSGTRIELRQSFSGEVVAGTSALAGYLSASSRENLFALAHPFGGVVLLKVSADGFISLGFEGLPDSSEREIRRFSRAAFSPDAALLAYGDHGRVVLVRLEDRKVARWWTAHKGLINAVAFSPDGKLLATSCSDDQTVKIWALPEARILRSLKQNDLFGGIAFSPDGQLLLACGRKSIYLWGVRDGNLANTINLDYPLADSSEEFSNRPVFSPDGRLMAVPNRLGPATVWRVGDGSRLWQIWESGGPGSGGIVALAFSPDGRFLATVGAGGSFAYWRLPDER
jgi:WD40 repeat protein